MVPVMRAGFVLVDRSREIIKYNSSQPAGTTMAKWGTPLLPPAPDAIPAVNVEHRFGESDERSGAKVPELKRCSDQRPTVVSRTIDRRGRAGTVVGPSA
jgi:hypothetical protein